MRKKWILIIGIVLLVLLGLYFAFGRKKAASKELPNAAAATHIVAKDDISSKIEISGEVRPETVVAIKSRVSGKIVKFYAQENDYVVSGQIIADIEPDYTQANTLFNTKASLQLAELALEKANKDFRDSEQLLAKGYVSANDHELKQDALQSAQIQYEQASRQYEMIRDLDVPGTVTHVYATASGTVIERAVNEGEMVSSSINSYGEGTVVMRIADLNKMIVKSNINEVDINKFKLGQKAEILLDALPYEEFKGEIVKIAPMAITENNAKVFPVEISINASGKLVKPGMTAAISIKGDVRQQVLVVPIAAVFADEQNNDIVYVLPAKDAKTAAAQPSPRVVKLGMNDFQMVEIISGLEAGEEISLEEPGGRTSGKMIMY